MSYTPLVSASFPCLEAHWVGLELLTDVKTENLVFVLECAFASSVIVIEVEV